MVKIGSVTLKNPLVLAPLAGYTNLPLRLLAKTHGAGLVVSEMVSATGLARNNKKTRVLLATDPQERPWGVQLFGQDPETMAEAARMAVEAGADIVDINFGCPAKKILRNNSGAALMKDIPLCGQIIRAVSDAVTVPVTIKMRSGHTPDGHQALFLGQAAQDSGAAAVTLHPRTVAQGFSGKADWELISRLKKAVSIPVIGNGDITSAALAVNMFTQTGCDAVMIGRAAVGHPWIFAETLKALEGQPYFPPTLQERKHLMLTYLRASVKAMDEAIACRMMRSRLAWFTKGLNQNRVFKDAVKTVETEIQAVEAIERYFEMLANQENSG